jgi:glutamine---fructose-6-phosphate transaminase (isomerizing)
MTRCTRCLVPDSYPGVSFDPNGVCNFCLAYRPQPTLGEERLLEKLAARKGHQYDCVIGLSGGKDSSYVAYLAKTKYKLRAIAVCYDFTFMRDLARRNVETICKTMDLELQVVKSRNDLERDLLRNHLTSLSRTGTTWGQCTFCHYGIEAVLYSVAREKRIPFILSGTTANETWWDPGNRTRILLNHVKRLPAGGVLEFLVFQLRAGMNLADQRRQFPIPGNSRLAVFSPARYPVDGPENVRIFDYVRWDHRTIEETLVRETGWMRPDKSLTWRYDCILEPLLDYTYKKEFGISTVGLYLSGLIREGLVSRDDAMKVMEEREEQSGLDRDMRMVLENLGLPERIRSRYLGTSSEEGR